MESLGVERRYERVGRWMVMAEGRKRLNARRKTERRRWKEPTDVERRYWVTARVKLGPLCICRDQRLSATRQATLAAGTPPHRPHLIYIPNFNLILQLQLQRQLIGLYSYISHVSVTAIMPSLASVSPTHPPLPIHSLICTVPPDSSFDL